MHLRSTVCLSQFGGSRRETNGKVEKSSPFDQLIAFRGRKVSRNRFDLAVLLVP
jgi:hypothetical protein